MTRKGHTRPSVEFASGQASIKGEVRRETSHFAPLDAPSVILPVTFTS